MVDQGFCKNLDGGASDARKECSALCKLRGLDQPDNDFSKA